MICHDIYIYIWSPSQNLPLLYIYIYIYICMHIHLLELDIYIYILFNLLLSIYLSFHEIPCAGLSIGNQMNSKLCCLAGTEYSDVCLMNRPNYGIAVTSKKVEHDTTTLQLWPWLLVISG